MEYLGWKLDLANLDKMTTGLQKGDLVIVAGRPSMGKTAFSMNIVEHVAIQSGLPVLVFSLEMPTEQLMMRMVSSSFKINMRKMQEGSMDANDWGNFNHAVQFLKKATSSLMKVYHLAPQKSAPRLVEYIKTTQIWR
jgi:replicative DNA helicase